MKWVIAFAAIMLVTQLSEHTSFNFAILHFMFVLLWAVAFNVAGGFSRVMGAYVFWFGLLSILVGTVTKAALGDPADSNSWTPDLSMLVYTASMAGLLAAVALVRKLTRSVPSMAEGIMRARPLPYRQAAVGSFLLGALIPFGAFFLPSGLYSILLIVNLLLPVSIILGTIAVIEDSGGRNTIGWLNAPAMLLQFTYGFTNYSKEGMFSPAVAWLVAVAYMRFRMRFVHILAVSACLWTAFYVLVPVAQVGRANPVRNIYGIYAATMLVTHLDQTREQYASMEDQVHETTKDYFSKDVGFLARLTRWPGDDTLISYTSHGNLVGYAGVRYNFLNWVPHFLMPDKEKYMPVNGLGGNYYAREVGMINTSDTSTGVSFGAPSEAFHIDRWTGIFLLLPLLWMAFLTAVELICGDLRATPWGLLPALLFAHVAPESGITGMIAYMWYGNIGLIFSIFFASYVAPVVGTLFVGADVRQTAAESIDHGADAAAVSV